MKRTPRLVLVTSVIALVTLFLSSLVSAHPVTIDGAAGADWFSQSLLPRANAGHILRNSSGQGEYAWKDVAGTATRAGDQRIIPDPTQSITKAVDLNQFRVTADATNLYFLAEMDVIPTSIPNGKLPQLQIAIQTPTGAHANSTLISPNGTVAVSTTVASSANWDFLVQTQFQTGLTQPAKLYTAPGSSSNAGAATLTKSTGNTMEIRIPWSSIGGQPTKDKHLRLTTAVLYSDGSAPADGADSKVVDAVSSASDTLAEVTDGDIDTFSDVYFDTDGNPYAPLLVSEVVPRPKNNSKAGQWVEIYNNSGVALNLSGFKFGDEANRGGSPSATDTDGMFQLPSISLPAGQVLIVTRNKGEFDLLLYPPAQLPPSFTRIYSTDQTETGHLSKYTAWSNGKFDLKDRPTDPLNPVPFSDEQLILDQSDTIIDLVQYAVQGAATYPGVTALPVPLAGIPSDTSFQRSPASRDTNDHTLDFVVTSTFATQTPGNANTTTQTDLSMVKTGPTAQLVSTQAEYVLHYSNANAGAVGATNVVITDTLPASVAYVSEGSSPPIAPSSEPVAGVRQWNLPTLNPGASGVITVTVTLPALPQVITNTAEISIAAGGAVTEFDPSNNMSQLETTVTPVPQPDVGISKTLTNPGQAYPTGQAIYQIDYANTGDADAATVTIVDTIPAGLTYVSNSGGFTATPGAGTVTFDLGTLPGTSRSRSTSPRAPRWAARWSTT
jgi:uncharacterized repeat protein (TIGR01451 family)